MSASIGIALCPDHANEVQRLLELADVAMYEAKRAGRGTLEFATAPRPAATGDASDPV